MVNYVDPGEFYGVGGVSNRSRRYAPDLAAFDYDAPRRRLALVYFARRDGCWRVERGGGVQSWTELHVVGEMLFGDSPWRSAAVVAVFGRLGSVEAAVAALAPPDVGFAYAFAFEVDLEKPKSGPRAVYRRGMWEPLEAAFYASEAS